MFRITSYKYFIIIILGFISLSSCKKQAEPVFELEYPLPFEINSGRSVLRIFVEYFEDIKSDLDLQLSARNLNMDDIQEILPYDIRLVSADGRSIDYGQMNEIKVYISDGIAQGSNIEIAYVKPRLAENDNGIQLIPGIADMIPYLENEIFNIDLVINFREISNYSDQILYVNFAVYTK